MKSNRQKSPAGPRALGPMEPHWSAALVSRHGRHGRRVDEWAVGLPHLNNPLNDSGMNNPINIMVIYPSGGCSSRPIIHVADADAGADAGAVAGAVADTDETYGAQAAAENNTFTNTNNSANNANNSANNAYDSAGHVNIVATLDMFLKRIIRGQMSETIF